MNHGGVVVVLLLSNLRSPSSNPAVDVSYVEIRVFFPTIADCDTHTIPCPLIELIKMIM